MIKWFVLLAIGLSGCSKLASERRQFDANFFAAGETSLNPSTDKLTDGCVGNPEFDACLYFKNPVAQEKRAVQMSERESLRRFGVKIRGLNPTGYLENARVAVYALNSPRFHLQSVRDLRAAGHADKLAQFSAYYWSNRLFDYLGARVGEERLPLRGLKIYVDDAFTGYAATNNSLHLQKKEDQWEKALSGEVVVHLAAQALAHAIANNKLFSKDPKQHNFCQLDPKGCCATNAGCAQALGNSFGEYAAAMMFPNSARAGEAAQNSNQGQKICGLDRDLASLALLTKAQVFAACQPAGRAVLTGAWYASQWWKLRAQLEAQEPGAAQDVDKIFFDHAKVWDDDATFTTAKAEALRLAGIYKNGKYLAAMISGLSGI